MSAQLRVLVVDDDADIRVIAALSLGLDPGMTVATAATYAETSAALVSGADVILLDVMMPDMDGPTMLARIRALPDHAKTPILFMTAQARTADIARYLALGAAGVIVKPFDPLRLAGEVRAAIAQAASG